MDLFAYGRLADPMHITSILERTPAGPETATAAGYIFHPTGLGDGILMIGSPGDLAVGVIWRNLAPAERVVLDEYQGVGMKPPRVVLRQVSVRCGGKTEEVWTYIGNPEFWEEKLMPRDQISG